MSIPVGIGLPLWIDTEVYLSAPEMRDLPEERHASTTGTCLACGGPPTPPTFRLEGAHAVRKGMGGSKKAGPTYELCSQCHTGPEGLDRCETWAILVRRDSGESVRVDYDRETGETTERPLRWCG